MKRKMEVSELIFKIIAYIVLIVFALMCVYPLFYALGSAFSSKDAINAGKVVLWPVIGSEGSYQIGFSITSFKYVIQSGAFWISYANTLFTTFFGTIWCLVYSILGAYALSKKKLLGRHGWNFFLVFTMWFSAGVVATYSNYKATGEVFAAFIGGSSMYDIDLKWLVVLAMGMNATNVILLRNSFEGVPSEIEEAARIDGATEMQILMKVYIPMSKATIATVALFFGISRWNGYFWAAKVMGTSSTDGQTYSWPLQVYIRNALSYESTLLSGGEPYDGYFTWEDTNNYSGNGIVYAMVICAVIPILCIYPFIQKYFAKGVNMGGVKE